MASSERDNTGKPLRKWQIWIGFYHLGQGHDPPVKPQMIAEVDAATFDLACLKYELRSMLDSIERRERAGEYVDFQSRRWFYDWDKNSNRWTGRYFQSEDEALATFGHH